MSARKGYAISDGVTKSNFNFEYFIVNICVICELQLYQKIKWNHFGKKPSLFFIYLHIQLKLEFGYYAKTEYKIGLFMNFK